ncbi:MAG: hypothetical protein AAGD04_12010 [Pseudomonadota bacterium]
MKLVNLWDGLVSALYAIAILVLCGVPIWCSHLAIRYGIAPNWIYGFLAALGFFGGLIALNLLGKATRGVSPHRERRR